MIENRGAGRKFSAFWHISKPLRHIPFTSAFCFLDALQRSTPAARPLCDGSLAHSNATVFALYQFTHLSGKFRFESFVATWLVNGFAPEVFNH